MAIARLLSIIPEITWRRRQIDPVGELWIRRDEDIRIIATTMLINGRLRIRVRFRTLDGVIRFREERVELPTVGVHQDLVFRIGDAFILGVALFPEGVAYRRGQLFVQVEIQSSLLERSVTLFANYVMTQYSIGWPGATLIHPTEGSGNRLTVAGATPPSGLPAEIGPSGFERWRVLFFTASFATDGTTATRRVFLDIRGGTASLYRAMAESTQGRNTTQTYSGGVSAGAHANRNAFGLIEMPGEVLLESPDTIQLSANNIKSNDQVNGINAQVEQWITV